MQTKFLQQLLRRAGFDPGPLDGIRGPKTDRAVIAFKKSIGFRARAYVGPLTEKALLIAGNKTAAVMPWYDTAMSLYGLHESRDKAKLQRAFGEALAWLDPTEVAWCGAFVRTCLIGLTPRQTIQKNYLSARSWDSFGEWCKPQLGCVMTFWRGSPSSWKGHTGFYYAEDSKTYYILGGNQRNAVTVTRVAKRRFVQARFPIGFQQTGKRLLIDAGGHISTNEA